MTTLLAMMKLCPSLFCTSFLSGDHPVYAVVRAQGLHELAHAPLLVALGAPWFSGLLGAAALVGPGRG